MRFILSSLKKIITWGRLKLFRSHFRHFLVTESSPWVSADNIVNIFKIMYSSLPVVTTIFNLWFFSMDSCCWSFFFFFPNIHSWSYLESSFYLEWGTLAFIREQFKSSNSPKQPVLQGAWRQTLIPRLLDTRSNKLEPS